MRQYKYIDNNYEFTCYYGNFQKIKYDDKKEDYYLTFNGDRFYFNDCIKTGTPWTGKKSEHEKSFNVVGTWQEGYCIYELQCEDSELTDSSRCRIVYCPPSSHYVG